MSHNFDDFPAFTCTFVLCPNLHPSATQTSLVHMCIKLPSFSYSSKVSYCKWSRYLQRGFLGCDDHYQQRTYTAPIRDPSTLPLWINDRAEWTDSSGSRKRDISLIPFHWCLLPLSLVFSVSFESQGERGVDAEQKRLVFGWSGSGDLQMYSVSSPFLCTVEFSGFCICLALTSLCYLHLASVHRRSGLVLNNAYSSTKS